MLLKTVWDLTARVGFDLAKAGRSVKPVGVLHIASAIQADFPLVKCGVVVPAHYHAFYREVMLLFRTER